MRTFVPRFACAIFALAALLGVQEPAASADIGALTSLGKGGNDGFLDPAQAFQVDAVATAPDRIEVRYTVAPGYYLYRNKLRFSAAPNASAQLGPPALPEGETKSDEYFGKQQVYHHDFRVQLPVTRASGAAGTLSLKLTWQGCAEAGLCYPPVSHSFDISLPAAGTASLPAQPSGDAGTGYVSEQDWLAQLIRSGNLLWMLGAFYLSGLGLAFTPCVLPMVPIVSGIIAGHGAGLSRVKGFLLSLAYVLGMALTYTAAGVACAAAGQQAQTLFQQPWIIAVFAALFVAMSLSMFGVFTVQIPAGLQTRLAQLSNRQRAGSYLGVAVMGALSALIVTTCVGPALVAALSVIGRSGHVLRGGLALFAMAMGMGTPLLVVGASAGQLLPRAGAWMETVKQVFGAVLLAVAAWMLARILPSRVTLLLWSVPLVALAWVLARAALRQPVTRLLTRIAATATAAYAVLLIGGAATGATDPLAPWRRPVVTAEVPFRTIKSVTDLAREVDAARSAHRPVMLDFYADWCVSCKEMEKYTFPDPAVRKILDHVVLLRADVTANDSADQALLRQFGIFGPPTIAFYGSDGQERNRFRVVGFMKAGAFASLAARALADAGEADRVAAR